MKLANESLVCVAPSSKAKAIVSSRSSSHKSCSSDRFAETGIDFIVRFAWLSFSSMFFYSRAVGWIAFTASRAGQASCWLVGRTGGHALALLEWCRIEGYRIICKKLTCSKPRVHKVVPTNNQGRTTSPHLEPAPMLTRIYRLWEDAGFPFCSRSFDRVVIIDQWYVLRFETRETRFRTLVRQFSGHVTTLSNIEAQAPRA